MFPLTPAKAIWEVLSSCPGADRSSLRYRYPASTFAREKFCVTPTELTNRFESLARSSWTKLSAAMVVFSLGWYVALAPYFVVPPSLPVIERFRNVSMTGSEGGTTKYGANATYQSKEKTTITAESFVQADRAHDSNRFVSSCGV